MLGLLLFWRDDGAIFDLAWDVLHDHQYIFGRYVAIVIKVKSL